MASTIRHNRARGKHSVNGMANMVFQMADNGMDDAAICNELGMEAEELIRLKHITGFSKLFKDTEYNRAWVVRNQVKLRLAQEAKDAAIATQRLVEITAQPEKVIRGDDLAKRLEEIVSG